MKAAQLKNDYADADVWLGYWCIPQRELAAVSSVIDYVYRLMK